MQISKLTAVNYRSFDDEGISFEPTSGLNVIVGENNSGKTNILQTINVFLNYFKKQTNYRNEGFKGKNDQIRLELSLILDNSDVQFLKSKLLLNSPNEGEDYSKYFKNITLQINSAKTDMEISFAKYKISRYDDSSQNYYVSSRDGIISHGRSLINWSVLVGKIDSNNTLEQLILKYDQTRTNASEGSDQINLILMDLPFYEIFRDLLTRRIILFPEFRNRSLDSLGEDLIATDGNMLSSTLYNLKNGGIKKEQQYLKIQRKFTELFPQLSFNVKKESPYLYFFSQNDNFEIDHKSIGAGIIETLILLTHLIYYEGSIFLLDEPELHLHPHATRNISNIIFYSSNNNQIFCSTHSSKLIDLKSGLKESDLNESELNRNDLNESITLIRKRNDKSILKQIKFNELSDHDLRYLYSLDYDEKYKEIFFSRLVLLVEGDTEIGALPVFANKLKKNLDSSGISVIGVGGNNFVNHIKILSLLDIPYSVLCDQDTLATIESEFKIPINSSNSVRCSFLLAQLHKLNLLRDKDKEVILECDSLITFKEEERCDKVNCVKTKIKKGFYTDAAIRKLSPVAKNHNFYVLSSDFEGVINSPDIYLEGEKKFPKSKRLKGLYVAQKTNNVPSEFKEFIEWVYTTMTENV